jgi:hypothetical protein
MRFRFAAAKKPPRLSRERHGLKIEERTVFLNGAGHGFCHRNFRHLHTTVVRVYGNK